MMKYLLTSAGDEGPRTFKASRRIDLSQMMLHVEGENTAVEGFFEGVRDNEAVSIIYPPVEKVPTVPRTFDKVVEWLRLFEGFAGGVVDGGCLVFRDVVGLVPVFAEREGYIVTNVKAEALVRGLEPLPPATALNTSTKETVRYHKWRNVEAGPHQLLETLEKAVEKFCPRHVSVFFSGGLDSLILAKLLQDSGFSPLLLTVGTVDSHDFAAAEAAASFLGMDVEKTVVDEKIVAEALEMIEKVLGPLGYMDAAIAVAMYLLSKKSMEMGCGAAVLGQGADELFGGYMKYEKVFHEQGYPALAHALQRDFEMLAVEGLVRDFTAVRLGGAYPLPLYLTRDVVSVALSMPVEQKLGTHGGMVVRKQVLRMVGKMLGLGDLADRSKKALQYGSGLMKMVRRLR
jgi:asparagine synthase (glutamine-hydrolysing)